MLSEPQPVQTWAATYEWASMQGAEKLPEFVGSVKSEMVILVPDRWPRVQAYSFIYVATGGIYYYSNLAGQTLQCLLRVKEGLPLLVCNPVVNYQPSTMSSGDTISCEVTATADGMLAGSNAYKGLCRTGVVGNFNGNVYDTMFQYPDQQEEQINYGAQERYVAKLETGAEYRRRMAVISNPDWLMNFDANTAYLICRPEHSSYLEFTCDAYTTVTQLQLPTTGMTIPAYSRPQIDTSDTKIRCWHYYIVMSATGLVLSTEWNRQELDVADDYDCKTSQRTWLCSIVAGIEGVGSGSALPLNAGEQQSDVPVPNPAYAKIPWIPRLITFVPYATRVIGFSGLAGNTISVRAEGKSTIPAGSQDWVAYSLPYRQVFNPEKTAEYLNAYKDGVLKRTRLIPPMQNNENVLVHRGSVPQQYSYNSQYASDSHSQNSPEPSEPDNYRKVRLVEDMDGRRRSRAKTPGRRD
jgi:hypothetical protein